MMRFIKSNYYPNNSTIREPNREEGIVHARANAIIALGSFYKDEECPKEVLDFVKEIIENKSEPEIYRKISIGVFFELGGENIMDEHPFLSTIIQHNEESYSLRLTIVNHLIEHICDPKKKEPSEENMKIFMKSLRSHEIDKYYLNKINKRFEIN